MSPTPIRSRAAPGRLALATSLALLAGTAAWGQSSPYVIGASETITHDSNVARLGDADPRRATVASVPDWIATTALFGGIDQPIGRQRLFGNLSLRDNHYRENKDYNNLAYGLATGLDWETVERISGNLNLRMNRSLASFDRVLGNQSTLDKNIEQTRQYGATVRMGVVTDLTLEGGLSRQTQSFSAVGDRLEQNIFNVGMRYRTGGELTFGAGVRLTNGDYPDIGDSFKGRNLDLTTDWTPSPISNLNGRLSFGKTDHSAANANDFSGVTGALAWKWVPTGRLVFNTQISRETGNDSSFQTDQTTNGPVTATGDNSRLTSTLALSATYEASAKILLTSGFTYQKRKLTNSSTSSLVPATTDADRLTRLQFGARWVPTRTLEFNCNVGRDSRKADTSLLTYSYGATTVGCSGQISVNP